MSSSPDYSSENSASQSPPSGKIRLALILSGTLSLIVALAVGWRFSNADAMRSPSEVQSETQPQFLTQTPSIQPQPSPTPTFKVPQPVENQVVMGNLRHQSKNSTPNPDQLTTIPESKTPINSTPSPTQTPSKNYSTNTVQNPGENPKPQTNIFPKASSVNQNKTLNNTHLNDSFSPDYLRAKIEPEKFTMAQTKPEIQVEPEPDKSPPDPSAVKLRLRDTIFLALENNRTIKNQYLERIVQQQDLAVAEDKFVPDFTPRIALDWQNLEQGGTTNTTSGLVLSAQLEMKIPTGGELNLGWEGQRENRSGDNLDGQNNNIFRQNLELSFRQPLLRGGGIDLNQASIKIARIDETINLLDLKLTLIDQITDAILAYRRLLQAQEQLKIEQNSLEIAQQQVENTQVLIDAGRQARVDLVPVINRVANQEISVLDAENNLQQQRLTLLEILDLEQNLNIIAVEEITSVESQSLNFEMTKQLALENRPDYLKAKLDLERSQFELQVAENNRRWNIDLSTNVNRELAPDIVEDRTEVRAGIELRKTLGNRNIERDFQRSRVDLLQAENNLDEEFQEIEIELQNRIRDVNDNFRKLQLTQRATELAEQQFRNEEDKVKLGVGNSSVVDLVRFQEDLGRARNNELNAKIDYLNSITELNQVVGTTLETWNITIEQNIEEIDPNSISNYPNE
ncbi:outer membrane efflux family protein [Lyngbya aestuarii BL J]|uniref:Outer membrane efflux family protein n=1 Tax=Lyngbya aestuarii BL J TaxID=1348334 RepID=U7QAQ4_9CYAN|nr:TolC family protein [Lyngbya aestuarii]ERT04287.1 outer membrane efflux family protein [Lyngbya aestuarii BL J]